MTEFNKGLLLALATLSLTSSAALARSPQEHTYWDRYHNLQIIQKKDSTAKARVIGQVLNRRMAITAEEVPVVIRRSGANGNVLTADYAPQLQGATMGVIGPQGGDAVIIQGVMTAGTVRVNNTGDLEAMLDLLAICGMVGGHVIGIWYLIRTMRLTIKTPGNVLGGTAKGLTFISIGLLTPAFVNWAVAYARDAALFN